MTDLTEAKRLVEAARGDTITLPDRPLANLIAWWVRNGPTLLAEHEAALAEVERLRDELDEAESRITLLEDERRYE